MIQMSLEYGVHIYTRVCVCIYVCIYIYKIFEVRKSETKTLRKLRCAISLLSSSNICLVISLFTDLFSVQLILHTAARVLFWKIN